MNEKYLEQFVENALKEDIGSGDHSSLSCIPENAKGKAKLLVKQSGIIAGVSVAEKVFRQFDKFLAIDLFIKDGAKIFPGDVVFIVEGSVRSLLQTERLVLNIMQRMSGIATHTAQYVELLKGYKTKVLDTRKTTPGMRFIEKEAVRIGGGVNHRFGLFDMIMLKDNHIDFAGGIDAAIDSAVKYLKENKLKIKIEIEVRNLSDLEIVLTKGGVDRIMFDNFTPELTLEAVKMVNGRYETESSGGINLETVRQYAECGVDFVSVGALTHQVKSLDLSLKAIDY
ncbi:MAG: carboxylating nicotinate-nucleotide diphosphorylase [Bacteroidales bacterium]|nr:carboxylating nicotinate-nucleotide diphosphorylase [Bacteroidales bacterium]